MVISKLSKLPWTENEKDEETPCLGFLSYTVANTSSERETKCKQTNKKNEGEERKHTGILEDEEEIKFFSWVWKRETKGTD